MLAIVGMQVEMLVRSSELRLACKARAGAEKTGHVSLTSLYLIV